MPNLRMMIFFLLIGIAHPLWAQHKSVKLENDLKSYFNRVAVEVSNAEDPAVKREILNHTFNKVFNAVAALEKLPVGKENQNFLSAIHRSAQEKYDELHGLNGFTRVSDDELDAFSGYVVQDLEQADNVAIFTTTTTIIIVLLLILLLA